MDYFSPKQKLVIDGKLQQTPLEKFGKALQSDTVRAYLKSGDPNTRINSRTASIADIFMLLRLRVNRALSNIEDKDAHKTAAQIGTILRAMNEYTHGVLSESSRDALSIEMEEIFSRSSRLAEALRAHGFDELARVTESVFNLVKDQIMVDSDETRRGSHSLEDQVDLLRLESLVGRLKELNLGLDAVDPADLLKRLEHLGRRERLAGVQAKIPNASPGSLARDPALVVVSAIAGHRPVRYGDLGESSSSVSELISVGLPDANQVVDQQGLWLPPPPVAQQYYASASI